MSETTVVNMRQLEPYDVYIGRPPIKKRQFEYHYGNPFTHMHGFLDLIKVADRKAAVQAYKEWLTGKNWQDVEPLRRRWILEHLHELHGKILACWCHPLPCHGDVLAEIVDNGLDLFLI